MFAETSPKCDKIHGLRIKTIVRRQHVTYPDGSRVLVDVPIITARKTVVKRHPGNAPKPKAD